ncbi:MAG: ABC transporter permease [Lachnospiraceae bacterium]|nr:ABC transporter permease [Lachnospiraceae bacterium]
MKVIDLLRMSLESLFKRKVRTILTIMGVVIGTTSIVVMISLGIGMKNALLSEYESYGGLKSVEVSSPGRYDDSAKDKDPEETLLTDARIEDFMALEHVTSVNPCLQAQVVIKCGVYEGSFTIQGVSRSVLEEKAESLGQGSIPVAGEELKLLYGNMILADFMNSRTNQYDYWETGELPDIDLMNDQVFVIFDTEKYYASKYPSGDSAPVTAPKKYVIETAGVFAGEPGEWSADSYNIYCDIDALREVLSREFKGRVIPGQPTRKNGKPYKDLFYSSVTVNVDEMDNVTMVQQIISDMGYNAYSNAEWIESDMKIMNIIQAVLGGIGGISLFVAAIGITNTMMMSIYERTKEIGIMKVIGCRIRDIQLLFLIEAGYIGFIGGGIGMVLSYAISYIMNKVLGLGEMMFEEGAKLSVIPPWLALLAITFAALIAMLAGFLPSLRAMKLSPLAAIRAE